MALNWRDALKRATAPPGSAAARIDPVAIDPTPIDPGAVSPALKQLLDERKRMEAEMAGLTGQADADPRYAVVPLGQRRAELARWAKARDDSRPASSPRGPDPEPPIRERVKPERIAAPRPKADAPREQRPDRDIPDRSVAGRMLAALAPERDAPALRSTQGETAAGTPSRADAFVAMRDALRGGKARPERRRNDASGLLDKTLDRIVSPVAKPLGEAALTRAKRAIPDDWRERARRTAPGLGEDSTYARRARKLLTVAVGSVDDFTSKAERVRDTLRDARELKAADDAGDDARRDRALAKLKAKRQEDA